MRIVIGLCRHCTLSKYCHHKAEIRQGAKGIKPDITLCYNCKEYGRILPLNTDVEIELHEIEGDSGVGFEGPPEPSFEWVSRGWVSGVIVDYSRGFYIVKLKEPIELCLPNRGGAWSTAELREVTVIRKRLNKMRVKRGSDGSK